jgi:hypothetical protein
MFNPSIWQLKSCPKCGGDRCLEITGESLDLVCLQCGQRTEATPSPLPVRGRPVKSKFKREAKIKTGKPIKV